jgi:hypothetical protein
VSTRPADTAAAALGWLGRGQSFHALAREIAWVAMRAAGAARDDLELMSPLVEARLGERFDQLPPLARAAARRAEADLVRSRPHDREGAELSAELAAQDAAVEHLSAAYMDVLDWAVGILRARQATAARRVPRWRRRFQAHADDSPIPCEVPQRILDGLAQRSELPGWRDRRAA